MGSGESMLRYDLSGEDIRHLSQGLARLSTLEAVRAKYGPALPLLHDGHHRMTPIQARPSRVSSSRGAGMRCRRTSATSP